MMKTKDKKHKRFIHSANKLCRIFNHIDFVRNCLIKILDKDKGIGYLLSVACYIDSGVEYFKVWYQSKYVTTERLIPYAKFIKSSKGRRDRIIEMVVKDIKCQEFSRAQIIIREELSEWAND